MTIRYQDAGVDLARSDDISGRLERRLSTGMFGGFFPAAELKRYEEPVLVSSMDGIGTKVQLAARLGRVSGLGRDIVHHCTNDIAVHGASPLFFLDYLAFHQLDANLVDTVVASMADACSALDIKLVGGETAEMPLVYRAGQFDIAGTIVGVVERNEVIDGSDIVDGDVLIGLPSTGSHTNGYSLIQALFGDEAYSRYEQSLETTLGDALLQPHRCYLHEIRDLVATGTVHGLAHITGGGISGNLSRIIPSGLEAVVELPSVPALFQLIQDRGVPRDEMLRVFNMGIGMIAVCDRSLLQSPPGYPIVGLVRPSTSHDRRVTIRDYD